MKKIWIFIFKVILITSCTSSYQAYNRKQHKIQKNKFRKESSSYQKENVYSKEMIKNQQDEDAKIISGWTEEKKKWFAENFIYKDVFFRNDTLFIIK